MRLEPKQYRPVTAAPVIHHRVGYEGCFCRVGSLQARRFVTDAVEKGLENIAEQ
jgi:hypothetical protein